MLNCCQDNNLELSLNVSPIFTLRKRILLHPKEKKKKDTAAACALPTSWTLDSEWEGPSKLEAVCRGWSAHSSVFPSNSLILYMLKVRFLYKIADGPFVKTHLSWLVPEKIIFRKQSSQTLVLELPCWSDYLGRCLQFHRQDGQHYRWALWRAQQNFGFLFHYFINGNLMNT